MSKETKLLQRAIMVGLMPSVVKYLPDADILDCNRNQNGKCVLREISEK